MSTVDPSIAATAEATRRAALQPTWRGLIAPLALLALAGFTAGIGAGGMGIAIAAPDGFGFEPGEGGFDQHLASLGIVVGLILLIVSSIIWSGVVLKRGKGGMAFGNATVLLAGAFGINYWSGRSFESVPQGDTLHFEIALAVFALGLLILFFAIKKAVKRASIRARRDAVMAHGTLVTATVTDQGYAQMPQFGRLHTVVTFTFHDSHGVQRWVAKPMIVLPENPIRRGDETRLWYDTNYPDDTTVMSIEAVLNSPPTPSLAPPL